MFYIETAVAVTGAAPSIAIDGLGRPWIGYWTRETTSEGTLRLGVRTAGEWSFETVPIQTQVPTDIIIDTFGSPAAGYSDGLTFRYLYKSGGIWTSESIGGFGPNASVLVADQSGLPFAAYVWSFHYIGYISISYRDITGWVQMCQHEGYDWFNPPWARIDMFVDRNRLVHICVNPIWDQYYYIRGCMMETLPSNLGSNFSIAASSIGWPMISYTSGGKLWIITKSADDWITSFVAEVDACGNTEIAFDIHDKPHIAYCDETGGVNRIMYAVTESPFDPWEIHEIDEGRAVSMALDSSGYPHIAYITRVHNPPGWDLKYASTSPSTPVRMKSWSGVKSLLKER
jgi:hypothetical protein